jgi:hypothetical protein
MLLACKFLLELLDLFLGVLALDIDLIPLGFDLQWISMRIARQIGARSIPQLPTPMPAPRANVAVL